MFTSLRHATRTSNCSKRVETFSTPQAKRPHYPSFRFQFPVMDSWLKRGKRTDPLRGIATPAFAVSYFFAASFLATSSASAAGTLTSGSTPVPSQFVLETGFIARANGTPIVK
jgi:hypothetical protein